MTWSAEELAVLDTVLTFEEIVLSEHTCRERGLQWRLKLAQARECLGLRAASSVDEKISLNQIEETLSAVARNTDLLIRHYDQVGIDWGVYQEISSWDPDAQQPWLQASPEFQIPLNLENHPLETSAYRALSVCHTLGALLLRASER